MVSTRVHVLMASLDQTALHRSSSYQLIDYKKLKVKADNLYSATYRESLVSGRSDTDHTVLPANDTVPLTQLVSIPQTAPPRI